MSFGKLILFVHIPKTAGTSLRRSLENEAAVVMHYDYGERSPATNALLDHLAKGGRVREKTNIICGHVDYKKYSQYVNKEDVISILRNPIERLVSEYQHRVRHAGLTATFAEFVSLSGAIDKQSKRLEGADVLENGLIGLTSHYDDFVSLVNKRLGLEIQSATHNQAPKSDHEERFNVPLNEINLAFSSNKKDMDFFMRAVIAFRDALSRDGRNTVPSGEARLGCRILDSKKIIGWVACSDTDSLFIELSVNGEARAVVALDQLMPEIVERGLSESPRCGFSYPLALLGAGEGDVIGVRVIGCEQCSKEVVVG